MKAFILLFIIFSAIVSSNAQKSPPPAIPVVDHMYLVLMWPFGYCSDQRTTPCRLSPLPQDMTIHGLWPVDRAGNSIIERQPSNAPISLSGRLESALLVNWPSLIGPITETARQRSFWSHEYNKHGKYHTQIAEDYFWAGIRLKQSTGIFQALKAAKINPGRYYNRADFEKAIEPKVHTGDFFLRCLRKELGEVLLKEIYLCIDAQAKNVIPCPKHEVQNNDNCGTGPIKFVSAVEN